MASTSTSPIKRSPSTASRASALSVPRSNGEKREAFVMSSLASRRSRARSSSTASSMAVPPALAVSMTSRGFTSGKINYISSPIGRAPLPEDSPPPSPSTESRRLGPLSPRLSLRSPSKRPVRTPTHSLLPTSPTSPPSPTSPSLKRRKRASDLSALLGPLTGTKPREIHLEEDEEQDVEDDEPDWGFTGPLQPIISRSSAGDSIRMETRQQPSESTEGPLSPRSKPSSLADGRPSSTRQGSFSSTSSPTQSHARSYHYVRQASIDDDAAPQSLARAPSGVSARSGATVTQKKGLLRSASTRHAPSRPPRPPSLVSDLILHMWDAPLDAHTQQQLADEVRQARPPPSSFRAMSAGKVAALQTQAYGGIESLLEQPLPSPTPSQMVRRRNSELFSDPYRPSAAAATSASTGLSSAANSIRSNRSGRRRSGRSETPDTAVTRPTSQDSKASARTQRLSSTTDGSYLLATPSLTSHRASTSSILSRIPPLTPPPSMAIPPTPDEVARRESTIFETPAASQIAKLSRHHRTDTKEIILGFPLPPMRGERSAASGSAVRSLPRSSSPDLAALSKSTPRPRRQASSVVEEDVESDIDLESPLTALAIKEKIISPRSPSLRAFGPASGSGRLSMLSRKDSAQMLRTGKALTRGLGWSDSEDDDACDVRVAAGFSQQALPRAQPGHTVLLAPGRTATSTLPHLRRRSSGLSSTGSPSSDSGRRGSSNADRDSGHWRSVSSRSSISYSDHLLMTPGGNVLSPPPRQALEAWGEPEITIEEGLGHLSESDEALDLVKAEKQIEVSTHSPPSAFRSVSSPRPSMPRRQSSLPIAAAWGAQRKSAVRISPRIYN